MVEDESEPGGDDAPAALDEPAAELLDELLLLLLPHAATAIAQASRTARSHT
jgi:hypothetical protein